MCWWLLGRIGVERLIDRFWLAAVRLLDADPVGDDPRRRLAHGPLIATILTFACLIELWGRRRAWLVGLVAGAAA